MIKLVMTSKKEGFKRCPSSRIHYIVLNNPHSGLESQDPAIVALFHCLFPLDVLILDTENTDDEKQ